MNDFLVGFMGGIIGGGLSRGDYYSDHTHSYSDNKLDEIRNELKKANYLKEKENSLREEKIYLQKVKTFLETIDVNCDKDSLEISIYDEDEERRYYGMFSDECRKVHDKNPPGRWFQETEVLVYQTLRNKQNKTTDETFMMNAYEKWTLGTVKHFGKIIGKTNDRYDYIMYLKIGPSYQAKYITQEELLKIISENKYGYSKHLMGI